jgi:hypothetical protein
LRRPEDGSTSILYSTVSPSASDRYPCIWISVWWTKTSLDPSEGTMKPKLNGGTMRGRGGEIFQQGEVVQRVRGAKTLEVAGRDEH